ncbi:MAG: hypothetical protein NVSMB18_17540 [Acetobacteraceae bacterium]
MTRSTTHQDQGRQREEAVAFDTWIRAGLRDRYGWVAGENLPESIMQVLADTPPEH